MCDRVQSTPFHPVAHLHSCVKDPEYDGQYPVAAVLDFDPHVSPHGLPDIGI